MKKFCLIILLLIYFSNGYSQQADHYWSIGINPLSFAESQLSIGPCIGYRLNKRIEFWTEASYIFSNSYMPKEWKKMQGFRFVLQPRYFINYDKTFFITPEFRFKSYSFNNRLTFINSSIHDTLNNFPFRETQTLIGGALVFGRKYNISRKHNVIMEFTFGLGSKTRNIKRKNVPAGYEYNTSIYQRDGLYVSYEIDKQAVIYIPLCTRFIWNFK